MESADRLPCPRIGDAYDAWPPTEEAPFQSRRAANGEKVLKPLGRRVGAMGEESVITYAETQAPGHPV